MTSQYDAQQQIKDRTPVDSALYDLSIDKCGTDIEPTGAHQKVPIDRGFQFQITITNRDTRTRQYELRVTVTDVADTSQFRDVPEFNTGRLAPGESETLQRQGWLLFDSPNGISCSAEVWPSVIEILDPPPDDA